MGFKEMWNSRTALASLDDDRALLIELLDIWSRQASELVQSLQCSAQSGDMQAVRDTAHILKGSLQILAADRAVERTCRLEQLASEGQIAAIPAQLQCVIDALDELQCKIDEWLLEESGGSTARTCAPDSVSSLAMDSGRSS